MGAPKVRRGQRQAEMAATRALMVGGQPLN